jgi:hypothetical protein
MPQPRFDELRERLLRAGIAPRHVRRYVGELTDHFDDLVREETAAGAARNVAESNARARLGNDHDLAETMLQRPGLRSLPARYPWAVFGLSPLVLLVAGFAVAILLEAQAFNLISRFDTNPAHVPPPAWFMLIVAAWNALPTFVAPLTIAGLLCFVGARQRVPTGWIVTGVVIACVVGGFQQLSFTDDGHHGELVLGSGLLPPFQRDLVIAGIWRAVADLALVGGGWWLALRAGELPARKMAPAVG